MGAGLGCHNLECCTGSGEIGKIDFSPTKRAQVGATQGVGVDLESIGLMWRGETGRFPPRRGCYGPK